MYWFIFEKIDLEISELNLIEYNDVMCLGIKKIKCYY